MESAVLVLWSQCVVVLAGCAKIKLLNRLNLDAALAANGLAGDQIVSVKVACASHLTGLKHIPKQLTSRNDSSQIKYFINVDF